MYGPENSYPSISALKIKLTNAQCYVFNGFLWDMQCADHVVAFVSKVFRLGMDFDTEN